MIIMDSINKPNTDHKSIMFLAVFAATASMIGWVFFTYLRPVVIEAGCSEIAEQSSGIFSNNRYEINDEYEYTNTKYNCIHSANANQ